MDPDKSTQIQPDNLTNCTARWGLLAFGWLNVGLGMIGVVVPGMPTTIFLIIAVWAFSKCSVRFQRWLWEHPKFGPSIRAWHLHRVIPVKAKIMAASMMAVSLIIVTLFFADTPSGFDLYVNPKYFDRSLGSIMSIETTCQCAIGAVEIQT